MKNIPPNIYIYPMVPVSQMASKNPYIENLINSISKYSNIVNDKDYSKLGIISGYKYLFKTDIFYFNWIENIRFRKFGLMQSVAAFFLLFLIALFNKKIVWTMHNKSNHFKKSVVYDFFYSYLIKRASLIIVHTKESIHLIQDSSSDSKIFFRFHPVKCQFENAKSIADQQQDIDILIWGTMNPYKGVYDFLKAEAKNLKDLNIRIVGKFEDPQYFEIVSAFKTKNITIEDKFIDMIELRELHMRSKFVLFPYKNESVFNSGALVDALCYGRPIIGPDNGAFSDLGSEKLISVYKTYADVRHIFNSNQSTLNTARKLAEFCKENSWENFGTMLSKELESL